MTTTISETTVITDDQRARAKRAAIATSVGNALEWFDILVYASFAVVISKLFFPSADGVTGLLLVFGTFGLSYVIRPLGAMVLGNYADTAGRKKALTLTIALMTVGTGIMAFAPTAASIGVWAGVVILVSRLLQGFSAGGEFGTSTAFLIEHAPNHKAFYTSWQVATQGAAMFLASVFGFGLNRFLSQGALESWGWRVPFVFGMLIGPIGLYIRMKVDETPVFVKADRVKSPLLTMFTHHIELVLSSAAIVGLATISVYLILYMPTFAVKDLHLPAYAGFFGGIVAGLVTLVGAPFIGKLADRVGCVKVMSVAAVTAMVVGWPLFKILVVFQTVLALTFVEVILGILMAVYFGPLPALLGQMFPTNIRSTGMSVGYNIGVTVFGGFAPLILTWLIARTGSLLAPSYYYVLVAMVSLVGLTMARTRHGQR
jgi:MHS family proline/betaine transporter-like MFS transporter